MNPTRYPERWRDWPDETRQPCLADILRGKGANSCSAEALRDKERGMSITHTLFLFEEGFHFIQ